MPVRIDHCNPAVGPSAGGIDVTIAGDGFVAGATVHFGAQAAVVTNVAADALTVTLPVVAPGAVAVRVDLLDGSTFTLANAFTFHAPTITAIAPNQCACGEDTVVTITGTHFVAGLAVTFGGTAAAALAVDGPTQVRAQVPDNVVGAVAVRVTNPAGEHAEQAGGFTFHAPTITGIAPVEGTSAGGTLVTITGTNFVDGLAVEVGGNPVADLARDSDTQIRVLTPAGALGARTVRVTNPGGVHVDQVGAFTFRAPTVAAVAPAFGPVGGGTAVRITGTFIDEQTTVRFGANASPKVWVQDETTAYAAVPAGAGAGAVDVRVTNSDGRHAQLNAAFTYGAIANMGDNEVTFLMDGEQYFGELRTQLQAMVAAAPNAQTYVRLAFWMIVDDVYVGDRTHYGIAANTLVNQIGDVIMAGHDVDVIVWYPNMKDRFKEGGHAEHHDALADALAAKDLIAAAAAAVVPAPVPLPGRVRVYLERYDGVTGSSNHQKIAIFSFAGQRTALVGGFNLANYYWDAADHKRYMNDPTKIGGWHDTAVRVIGPATDDIEAEWMRRWNRAVAMQASLFTFNNLKNQLRSRYTGVGSRSTIRAAAVAITANNTVQNAPNPTTTTTIRLTRSTSSTRYRDLRDELLTRIGAAQHYVYMENNQFTDPEIVRALYQRWAAHNALRIRVVTNIGGGGGFGFMTRRSWLQLILRMPHPICQRVYYMSKSHDGVERHVDRAGAGTWNVVDSYDGSTGATLKPHQRWLLNDGLEIDKATGAGTKTVPFTRITRVVGSFHFYTPLALVAGGTDFEQPTVHSKLAIFDDEYLVVGTSNWTYRSMQYDGEIATFNRCPPAGTPTLVTEARDRLLAHYDEISPLWLNVTGDNLEAVAQANGERLRSNAIPDNNFVLLPLCDPQVEDLGNVREAPGVTSMPSYQWI